MEIEFQEYTEVLAWSYAAHFANLSTTTDIQLYKHPVFSIFPITLYQMLISGTLSNTRVV